MSTTNTTSTLAACFSKFESLFHRSFWRGAKHFFQRVIGQKTIAGEDIDQPFSTAVSSAKTELRRKHSFSPSSQAVLTVVCSSDVERFIEILSNGV